MANQIEVIDENEKENSDEVYTVSIANSVIAVGGGNESVVLSDIKSEEILLVSDSFGESIVFCKIIEKSADDVKFIVVTVDGMIYCISKIEHVLDLVQIDESVSTCAFIDSCLLVGAESGKIYAYSDHIEHINTISGDSQIIDIDKNGDQYYGLSVNQVIVGDQYGNILFRKMLDNPNCIKAVSGGVFAVGTDKKVFIFKNNTKLMEYSTGGAVESICISERSFVLSGQFDGLIVISMANYSVFNMKMGMEMSNLRHVSTYGLLFTTIIQDNEQYVGYLDVRDKNSCRKQPVSVGHVFDIAFELNNNGITTVLGGELGHEVVEISLK
ncbi:hypothetical protein ECANGB1_1008 [Enterospora canceri]|uniref:Uncharacterized protein n=1 Tax=Enterospora canceri TaxID=1081671 RepID=A0A1Y1S6Z9_9MICR|nr:hypothetical protein ECANGB1_1008 [Enterospora canceri]